MTIDRYSFEHRGKELFVQECFYPPTARRLFDNDPQLNTGLAKNMSTIGNIDFYVSGRDIGHNQYELSIVYDVTSNPTAKFVGRGLDISHRIHDFFFGPQVGPGDPPRPQPGQRYFQQARASSAGGPPRANLPMPQSVPRPQPEPRVRPTPPPQQPPPQPSSASFFGNMVRYLAAFVDWLVGIICYPFTG